MTATPSDYRLTTASAVRVRTIAIGSSCPCTSSHACTVVSLHMLRIDSSRNVMLLKLLDHTL